MSAVADIPLVSIVIPAYNCGKYIAATLDSILAQHFQNFEIIIVNDGSTDDTPEMLQQQSLRDNRITLVHQANGRQGKARNNGIGHARGSWVAFLDADDLWMPEKLSVQLEKTLASGADMSFTDGFICLNNQMDLEQYRFGVENRLFQGPEAIEAFHLQNRVPTSTVLVKREVLLAAGGFPEDLVIQNCEDYFLWTLLLTKGFRLLGIATPLLRYRVYPESSTGTEIKGLRPLLVCLLRIPGEHGKARQIHLEKTLLRLLSLSKTQDELSWFNPWIASVTTAIRQGTLSRLMRFCWQVHPRLYISLLWRTRITH
ncbi:MAG: glycosyltransferase family 2 protein [Bacteroidia bacterium]|nr:glycosyltransferase family 2 protein [Bacteroidia bacterium]